MAYDADFDKVSLLLHGDGANGSNTFIDSSPDPKTPLVFGGPVHNTTTKKYGTSSIGGFDGSGDCILLPYSPSLHLPGDFTIELWLNSSSRSGFILCAGGGSSIAWASYQLVWSGGGNINFAASSTNTGYNIGSESGATGLVGNVAASTWAHVMVTCQGNVYRGFVNGVMGYNQTVAAHPFDPATRGLSIGANFSNVWGVGVPQNVTTGFYDDIRITKGKARQTANFTPPAGPHPDFLAKFTGNIKDSAGANTAAKVRAYREATGALVSETMSDGGTGNYELGAKFADAHTLLFYPSAGEATPLQVKAYNGVLPV